MFWLNKTEQIDNPADRLRHIADHTTSGWMDHSHDGRTDYRYNRAIPALLVRWEDGRPAENEWAVVITRDISDSGVGLILGTPTTEIEEVVIGLWPPIENMNSPWFFVGKSRYCTPIGGGFWSLGIEIIEFANDKYREELQCLLPLAKKLIPEGWDLLIPKKKLGIGR